MKELLKIVGKEEWLKLNYAMVRYKNSKKAMKTDYDPNDCILTLKKVIRPEDGKELMQLHLRFPGKDKWNNEEDLIDVDIYYY